MRSNDLTTLFRLLNRSYKSCNRSTIISSNYSSNLSTCSHLKVSVFIMQVDQHLHHSRQARSFSHKLLSPSHPTTNSKSIIQSNNNSKLSNRLHQHLVCKRVSILSQAHCSLRNRLRLSHSKSCKCSLNPLSPSFLANNNRNLPNSNTRVHLFHSRTYRQCSIQLLIHSSHRRQSSHSSNSRLLSTQELLHSSHSSSHSQLCSILQMLLLYLSNNLSVKHLNRCKLCINNKLSNHKFNNQSCRPSKCNSFNSKNCRWSMRSLSYRQTLSQHCSNNLKCKLNTRSIISKNRLHNSSLLLNKSSTRPLKIRTQSTQQLVQCHRTQPCLL